MQKSTCFNLNFSNPGGTTPLQSLILSKANVSFRRLIKISVDTVSLSNNFRHKFGSLGDIVGVTKQNNDDQKTIAFIDLIEEFARVREMANPQNQSRLRNTWEY
jgi:hypothetical protein